MSTKIPQNFEQTIILIAQILKGRQYAIRGTASLVLQGIEMNVDDIDILCNKETALECNKIFKDYLIKEIAYKGSDKFKSYFGEFNIQGVKVEVMGDWQIWDGGLTQKGVKGSWSKVFCADESEKTTVNLKDAKDTTDTAIYVTTIETELLMFALMGRWSAYQKIKRRYENKTQAHLLLI